MKTSACLTVSLRAMGPVQRSAASIWSIIRMTCVNGGSGILGEKQCFVLVNLPTRQLHMPHRLLTIHTFKTRMRSGIISQSSSSNSYFWSLRVLSMVIWSIAQQYCSAIWSMSYVEFQCVFTSCGINQTRSDWATQILRYAGRAIVVE